MEHISVAVAQLRLFGTAGLYLGGKRIPLRNKSLAILYYLALEGPTSRTAMAELLWEHASAKQNLRVELHELRRSLRKLGIAAFEDRCDPLTLPAGIALDTTPRAGRILEGLERISDSFHGWLVEQRGRALRPDELPAEQIYVQAEELAREIDAPFLLIVKGSPLAGFKTFALQLARKMGLPFIEGAEGRAAAVRYLPLPQVEAQVERMLGDKQSVWVLPTAPFGEDPSTLLDLRARWPAGRARFVTLHPHSWPQAIRGPLQDLRFDRAAEVYLRSGGNAAHLKHLLELQRSEKETLSLPQQVRAAYQRESRYLSYSARLALERVAVHPGTLSEGLIEAFAAHEYLDELERRGWLAYEEDWFFASEPARCVLYQALQPGRRAEYHRTAARYFMAKGERIPQYYHEWAAAQESGIPAPPEGLAPWAQVVWGSMLQEPPKADNVDLPKVKPGDVLLYEPPEMSGGWGSYEDRFYFLRNGPPYRENKIVFPGAEVAVLIRIRGRGHVENVFGVGMDGKRTPLVLHVGEQALAVFAPLSQAMVREGLLIFPIREFDLWVFVPAGEQVRFSSAAERAILEFSIELRRAPKGLRGKARPVRLHA